MNQKNKKKVCLFFNHERGLNVFKYLNKNKDYEVSKVFLSKKNYSYHKEIKIFLFFSKKS